MAKVLPFKGLRYTDKNLSKLTTPPYDIISPEEQLKFYEADPNNVIRLEYAITYPDDTPSNNRYTRSRIELERMLKDEVLKREEEAAFYIYEEIFQNNGETLSLKGIIGIVELSEFSEKKVLPHEETLSKAKADRFELMKATNCNFSQIYSLYNDQKQQLPKLLDSLSQREPDITFCAFDGLRQNVWIVSDKEKTDEITKLFEDKQLFIADGHHRYETALNYKKYMEENGGEGDLYKYCMMYLVDMSLPGLVVLPTHRIVRGLKDFNAQRLLEKAAEDFFVTETDMPEVEKVLRENSHKNAFAMYADKKAYVFVLKDKNTMARALEDRPVQYRDLDVSVLHTLVLEKLLGIDKQNMANQINLSYTRSVSEGVKAVDEASADCLFILNPTKVEQIKDISLVNEKMPQKSTYFYPKLVTGIVINPLF